MILFVISMVVFLFLIFLSFICLLIILHYKKNDNVKYQINIKLPHILQLNFDCKSTKRKK